MFTVLWNQINKNILQNFEFVVEKVDSFSSFKQNLIKVILVIFTSWYLEIEKVVPKIKINY